MDASRRLLVIAAVILASGCDVAYGPTSPSKNWVTSESLRFTIYAHPQSFAASEAASIVPILEDQFTYTVSTLALRPGGRISIFLYDSGAEIEPPLPNARAGVAFPETNAVHAVAFAPHDDDLNALLTHETNHIVIINGLGSAGTSFMTEGLATTMTSERFGPFGLTAVRRWAAANRSRLIRLSTLVDDEQWSSNSQDAYRTSAAFLGFLLDRYGAERLKSIYRARSDEIAGKVLSVYGKSLDALEAEWLGSL